MEDGWTMGAWAAFATEAAEIEDDDEAADDDDDDGDGSGSGTVAARWRRS